MSKGLQATIIAASIRARGVIVALACLLVGYGVFALGHAKYNVFPEFAPPQVSIQTEAPGLAPEGVESLVTRPIEAAVNGAAGVQIVRSLSIQGLSVVTVFFDASGDLPRDRQTITERLAVAGQQLPRGVGVPAMTPLSSSTSTVLIAGLTSTKRSLMDVRTVADWTVRQRLLATPGVADVSVFGQDVRSIQVQAHPDKLIQYGLSLSDVLAAAQKSTGLRGAGFIDTANQRLVLQSQGQPLTAQQIARTVVLSQGGGRVLLGDVADVVDAPEPAIGAATIQGRPGVLLVISEQYGASTLEVSKSVVAALEELRPALAAQGIVLDSTLFRPATFIQTALANIQSSLLVGGALVVVVLFLFLFDLRTAAISCTAIPLSLLTAIVVLEALGVSLNTMTLGGLAIAIGEVVDDAVIGVENIARRLRENRRLDQPAPSARVILNAVFEVRSAVVYATFAVILVFLPILALSGVAGRLFAPLGEAYILAVLASLAVALTVTPALAMIVLVRDTRLEHEPPVVRWSQHRYRRLLTPLLARPWPVMACAAAFTILALATLPFFRTDFLPALKEGHYVVHMAAAPGTSVQESLRIGGRVTAELLRVPGVRSVAQQIGRAEKGIDTDGPHYSEFQVDLTPLKGRAAERAEAGIRRAIDGVVGVNGSVNTFLSERVEETVSGFSAPVAVNIYGEDLDALDRSAGQIARVLSAVKGATEVRVQSPPGLPQVTIRLRQADLERWGLDPVEVLDAVHTGYEGEVAGQIYDQGRAFNVIAILDGRARSSIGGIGELPIKTPAGGFVLLKQVADVFQAAGRYQIQHEGARRLVTVTASVQGRGVGQFVQDAKAAVKAQVHLPAGAYISFAGTAAAQAASQRDLLVNSLIASVGIVLLLAVVTRNWRNLLLVLSNLPFALAGGVLAVFATGGVLDLGAMVGFVTVLGITLRNSIMMISHFEHLVELEGRTWGVETAIIGAGERLVPILMTSLVTALGLLPLALGRGDPGREIEGPMAVAILGGLMTSMVLNLVALPTLALAFGRFEPRAQDPGALAKDAVATPLPVS
jgi:CzcA family heavy metal efflux pump